MQLNYGVLGELPLLQVYSCSLPVPVLQDILGDSTLCCEDLWRSLEYLNQPMISTAGRCLHRSKAVLRRAPADLNGMGTSACVDGG